MEIQSIFEFPVVVENNFISISGNSSAVNQQQTNDTFSGKWEKFEKEDNLQEMEKFQKEWYLKLYGFKNEADLRSFLQDKKFILDAGCGLGYKAEWFASLSPASIVIGIDFSEAITIAANKYRDIKNLFFIQGDIADTGLKKETFDYISCDQVIMHTENPGATFTHLTSLLKPGGELACYVYTKKALPRELLDDYFRTATHKISSKDLWEMSMQLTQLGKTLSELQIKFTAPDIPLLGIKGGEYDIQRFIYWNFIKCFWNEDLGTALSDSTNYDWYSPSNAKRFSGEEFDKMGIDNNLKTIYRHSEEACHTARFKK